MHVYAIGMMVDGEFVDVADTIPNGVACYWFNLEGALSHKKKYPVGLKQFDVYAYDATTNTYTEVEHE